MQTQHHEAADIVYRGFVISVRYSANGAGFYWHAKRNDPRTGTTILNYDTMPKTMLLAVTAAMTRVDDRVNREQDGMDTRKDTNTAEPMRNEHAWRVNAIATALGVDPDSHVSWIEQLDDILTHAKEAQKDRDIVDTIRHRHGLPNAPEDAVATIEGWLHGLEVLMSIQEDYVGATIEDVDDMDKATREYLDRLTSLSARVGFAVDEHRRRKDD